MKVHSGIRILKSLLLLSVAICALSGWVQGQTQDQDLQQLKDKLQKLEQEMEELKGQISKAQQVATRIDSCSERMKLHLQTRMDT